MSRVLAVLSSLVVLGGCVSGAAPPGTSPGTITGVIDYDGPETGTLRVAVFASFPPTGAPLAEVAIDEPHFPQPYQLTGVRPGRHFVLAVVDTDPADGDRYRPRVDPGGAFGRYDNPATVRVDEIAATAGIDIALVAPAPGSPWDR